MMPLLGICAGIVCLPPAQNPNRAIFIRRSERKISMKRNSAWYPLTALAVLLAACSGTAAGKPQPTAAAPAPETNFASPAAGASLPLGKIPIVVQATAAGGVARIELQVNGLVVTTGENPDPSQTYYVLVYDWQPQAGGEYSLQARAQGKTGVWGALASLQLGVTAPEATETAAEEPEDTPTPESEITPTPLIGPNETSTKTPGPTPEAISSDLTVNLQIFNTRLYVADTACEPQTILVAATVSDPAKVAGVYISFQIHDPDSADLRGFTSGAPLYESETIPGKYLQYINTRYIWTPIPWVPADVYYMFYALDHDGSVVYRSEIFRDMKILKCAK
jgi:hypothetical protein